MIVRFEREGKEHNEETVHIYQTGEMLPPFFGHSELFDLHGIKRCCRNFFKYLVCLNLLVFFVLVILRNI